MAKSIDVFKVIVTKGSDPVLAKDKELEDLLPGQIGVFDAETHVSLDATSNFYDFYFAVGIDRDGDGVSEDFQFSAGARIQARNMRFVEKVNYVAPLPKVIKISDFKGTCNTEYSIRLDLSNLQILRRTGYNKFAKTYVTTTGCCGACETCGSGNCVEVALGLYNEIKNDKDGLVIPSMVTDIALTNAVHGVAVDLAIGDVVSEDDAAAVLSFNETADDADKVCIAIVLTTVPVKISDFCGIPRLEYKAKQTVVDAFLMQGFDCNGKVETIQEAVYENASGQQVREKEFYSNTRSTDVYQLSECGLPFEDREFFASSSTKYTEISLTYDYFGRSAWNEYLNNIATVIAIPEGETAVINALVAIINKSTTVSNMNPIV